jgi:hypothetical protein
MTNRAVVQQDRNPLYVSATCKWDDTGKSTRGRQG